MPNLVYVTLYCNRFGANMPWPPLSEALRNEKAEKAEAIAGQKKASMLVPLAPAGILCPSTLLATAAAASISLLDVGAALDDAVSPFASLSSLRDFASEGLPAGPAVFGPLIREARVICNEMLLEVRLYSVYLTVGAAVLAWILGIVFGPPPASHTCIWPPAITLTCAP